MTAGRVLLCIAGLATLSAVLALETGKRMDRPALAKLECVSEWHRVQGGGIVHEKTCKPRGGTNAD